MSNPDDHSDSAAPRDSGMRVVRGLPDDSELVALWAGLFSLTPEIEDSAAPTSAWMDRARTLRGVQGRAPLGRGISAWKHSLR